jgi:CheY-like chemotaxis protein
MSSDPARRAGTVLVLVVDDYKDTGDGFETVRVLRGHERTKQIPVLALTGAMLDSEGRAQEEGFSAFLRKPCLPQYLLHELRRFLPT